MKWRLVIRPRAETDLREAHGWYESQRLGLGAEFLAEIDKYDSGFDARSATSPSLLSWFLSGIGTAFSLQGVLQTGG